MCSATTAELGSEFSRTSARLTYLCRGPSPYGCFACDLGGADVKAIQRILGHSSAAMTLDVYAGLFSDDPDDVPTEWTCHTLHPEPYAVPTVEAS